MKRLTIYLGPPCGGKSTVALRAGIPRFSVRHWFEPLRTQLRLPAVGTFLDNEQVYSAVWAFLMENESAEDVILDGFPGNAEQLEWVMEEISPVREIRIRYIPVEYKTASLRAAKRRVCFCCDGGADPVVPRRDDICPVCHSKTGRRADDMWSRFRERWQAYFIRAREMYLRDRNGLYRKAVDDAHRLWLDKGVRIDLHLHTTFSDGIYTPQEMMEQAAVNGISVCAVTDHDTLSGIDEIKATAFALGIAIVPGIEISALWQGKLIHLLGYGIDPESQQLRFAIKTNQEARRVFDERVLSVMEERDMLPPGTVCRYSSYERRRREGGWKLLNFLMNEGVCRDGFAYLRLMEVLKIGEIPFLSAKEAIASIRDSGICVLAHPGAYSWTEETLLEHIDGLCAAGINGIECIHPQNSPALTNLLLRLCFHRRLLATGGSDDHGNLPDRALGTPYADTQILDLQAIADRILWPETQIG